MDGGQLDLPHLPLSERGKKQRVHGHRTMRRDGRRESPTYTTWRAMIQRCHDRNHRAYKDYGAMGIKVVPQWRKFDNFLADMGTRPQGKTLGRLTPFSDYGPGECEWQTILQQNRLAHSHADQLVTAGGMTYTKRAWARRLRIKYDQFLLRLRKWGVEDACLTPGRKPRGTRAPERKKRR